jgi:glycosyltransferase involved in cell wall biosynthesis
MSADTLSKTNARHETTNIPHVCVIATVRNEERYLEAALDSVLSQEYARPFHVILAIGPSRDNTYGIAKEYATRDPRVRIVENPTGLIPNGLNIALANCPTDTEIVVRFDGHTRLPHGYIKTMVDALVRTGAQNIGGLMKPVGKSPVEVAVARAMSHPLGIGPASFHVGGIEGPNETAYLGTFQMAALKQVGGYDEHYQRAEDWELNLRIRQAGGLIWFKPDVEVEYRPRSSFAALAHQCERTGMWRREVLRNNRQTASPRYLAPPIAVATMLMGTVLGLFGAVLGLAGQGWGWWLTLGFAAPVGYGLLVVLGGLWIGRDLPARACIRLPAVLATMHVSWGWGFLKGN